MGGEGLTTRERLRHTDKEMQVLLDDDSTGEKAKETATAAVQ